MPLAVHASPVLGLAPDGDGLFVEIPRLRLELGKGQGLTRFQKQKAVQDSFWIVASIAWFALADYAESRCKVLTQHTTDTQIPRPPCDMQSSCSSGVRQLQAKAVTELIA